MSMKIKDIIQHLETIAPLDYQEAYDNAGLLTGNLNDECTNALLCLDSTEEVVDEAIEKSCNLIIAHHPIIFSGLKKITGKNYIERTLIKAIKNDIAIYAIHTNLDNVFDGVNQKIAEKLGLSNRQVLIQRPQTTRKISVSVPLAHADFVRHALTKAGAGTLVDYDESSFSMLGVGIAADQKGQQASMKLDILFPAHLQSQVLAALRSSHPSPKPSYEILSIQNTYSQIGAGMVGDLAEDTSTTEFLKHLKSTMKADCIRHTRLLKKKVRRIAVCGGAGSFLLPQAIQAKADIFITADFKYHQFFDANEQIVIADIGHYESEQYTTEILQSILSQKFPNFAPIISQINTNPIKYL